MNRFFTLIAFAFLLSLNSCRNKKQAIKTDTTELNSSAKTDKSNQPATQTKESCIQIKIAEIKAEEKKNPPVEIYQYAYKGKTVYHISAQCCDIPSSVLDETCSLICSPDGGFTGTGDGKCSDFFEIATKKSLLWKDER